MVGKASVSPKSASLDEDACGEVVAMLSSGSHQKEGSGGKLWRSKESASPKEVGIDYAPIVAVIAVETFRMFL